MQGVKKVFTIMLVVIVLIGLSAAYFWFYIPFSDSGVKAGVLNNFKHKGIIFKTYEGELIQSGFRPGQSGLMSNEFQFSVDNQKVADRLMTLSGSTVQLHYKEYYGKLPWRGYTKFIVDSIVEVFPDPIPNMQQGMEVPPVVE